MQTLNGRHVTAPAGEGPLFAALRRFEFAATRNFSYQRNLTSD